MTKNEFYLESGTSHIEANVSEDGFYWLMVKDDWKESFGSVSLVCGEARQLYEWLGRTLKELEGK